MAAMRPTIPERAGDGPEIDYSDPSGDDFEALARDRVPVRSLNAEDLDGVLAVDRKITGQDRRTYFVRKLAETLEESGVRVSLAAELDGRIVGFIMARVDFGEFGRTEPEAVIDTIGVHPDYTHREVGRAMLSQLLANLAGLQVERVRTLVDWDQFDLLAFLARCGFHPAKRLALRRRI